MLFNYQALDQSGAKKEGAIDAINVDIAISSLQRRGFVVTGIREADSGRSLLSRNIAFFDRVSTKEVVILSRQLATLFEAQVSALRIFRLLAAETENATLAKKLTEVSDDLQSGNSISGALSKHPKIFSQFYISMVKAGEESGKLDDTFQYLADYLDRTYELSSKVKGALIYPAFVVFTFITVMILMFTAVIPKISAIIVESGTEIPVYTKIVLGISNFLTSYGFVILGVLIILGFFLIRFIRTPPGRYAYDHFKLEIPYISSLFRKLYLARMADNMSTMLSSGIPMIRALELTSDVINNTVYKNILSDAVESVKGGQTLSDSLSNNPREIPGIMTQMMKVGEESGELATILKTVAKFYGREVTTAIDSLVSLIEPAMIVLLGGGVAVLLASVLLPIYNIASTQ
ncbi:MAG: type II secretion system F family protein [Candidatus Paceibacterota bacterium]|jgi:type IV pilus assembly protein PilC